MAEMYEPYAADYTTGDMVRDSAVDMINPISAAKYWIMWPGNYSWNKGFGLPHFVGEIKKAVANKKLKPVAVAGAFKEATKTRSAKSLIKAAGSFVWGPRYWAGSSLRGKAATVQTVEDKLKKQLYTYYRKTGRGVWSANRVANQITGGLVKWTETASDMSMNNFVSGIKSGSGRRIRSALRGSGAFVKSPTGLTASKDLQAMAKAGGGRAVRNLSLLRMGVMAGRAISTIGMLSLIWDITSAVGEPIGRAAMTAVDKTLTAWGERFMPEVGGKIALSYLSQGAATERQRAVEALSKSSLGGRYAFGQEARMYHS